MLLRRALGRQAVGASTLGLAFLFLATGCSKPTTAHISGKVYQANGKPLPGGKVVFYPTEGKTRIATAEIQEDGSYDMPTAPTGKVLIAVNNIYLKEGVSPPMMMGGVGKSVAKGPKGKGGPPKGVLGPPKGAGEGEIPASTEDSGIDLARYVPIDSKFGDPQKSGLSYQVKPGSHTHDVKLSK